MTRRVAAFAPRYSARMHRLVLVLLLACGGKAKPPPPTVQLSATPQSAEAAYDAKNWAECATLWTNVAAQATGEQKAGAHYDAACCYALDGRLDAALTSLDAAFDAGYWDADNITTDADLQAVRANAQWPTIEARAKANFAAFEKSLRDPALRKELLAMAERDQKARAAITSADDKAGIEAAADVDRQTTARMKEIVTKQGWPGKSMVGVDGANAAWLLVQHADAAPVFQKECLEKMEPLVKSGEVSGKDFAYLWDRVAVNAGKKQRYGTQFEGEELAPLEDPDTVDERRKSVGLGTLAEYKELVKKLDAEEKARLQQP